MALRAIAGEKMMRRVERAGIPALRARQQRHAAQHCTETRNEMPDHRQDQGEHEYRGERDPRWPPLAQSCLGQSGRLGALFDFGLLLTLVECGNFHGAVIVLRRREQGQARVADGDDGARPDRGGVGDRVVDADAGKDQRFDLVLTARQLRDARVVERRAQVRQEDRLVRGAADAQHVAVVDVFLVGDGALALLQYSADQPAHVIRLPVKK